MSSGSFKDVIYKICLEIIYLIYVYEKDLPTETVLSSWLVADEGRVSHVLSHVVWWKLEMGVKYEG